MIQPVKLGTHRMGTNMYAISKCAFLLSFRLERGDATTILKKPKKLCNFCILHPISFILIPNESPLQELSNDMLYSVHRPPPPHTWLELVRGVNW